MISSSRTIARASAALFVLLLLLGGAGTPSAAARTWPRPQGYVSDFATAMDPASRDSIEALAGELDRKTGAQLAVVTVSDLGGDEIDPVAVDLYKAWGIGSKGKDEGVLILLAQKERRVRIEVGYGLEGILPDGLCGSIIRRVMAPELSQGKTGPGLLHGAAAVVGVIARDRGVTITGASPLPSEDGEGGGLSPRAIFFIALLVAGLLSRLLQAGSSRRGWMGRRGPWWWGGGGPGGYGGMFGGFGGMGGGFGGGGGGGGFGGFGGGRSGGGGASGGF